jgi:hypothetical protein
MAGRRGAVLRALLAGAFISGCGGAASGGPASSPDSGVSAADAGAGDGGLAGDARSATLDAVSARMAGFDGTDQDAENRDLLAFVEGRSEFTASGLSEGGAVWARFADGTTLVMGNNLIATRPEGLLARRAPLARASRFLGTPGTSNVVLGASLGTVYENVNDDIAEMFQQQIYDRVQPDSSVDALKSLGGVAVLYLNAHGATVPLRKGGSPEYTLWTSTVREKDGSSDAKYLADLADGSLTYFMSHKFDDDAASPGGIRKVVETHYAITAKFVRKYWAGAFATNSVVFINACRSASLDAFDFELAAIEAGAGIYFGWTDRVQGGDAALSAAWFFDRSLGTNSDKLPQEKPAQRPFPLLAVWDEMKKRLRPGGDTMLDSSTNPQTGLTATLTPFSLGGNAGLLAPSIDSVFAQESTDELFVNGALGDVQGSILVGDADLVIKSWDGSGAVCDLPPSGANAAGPIKVIVNGGSQFSNVVPLTSWHGTAIYTVEEVGSLTMTMTFDFVFRGDIHTPRETPGQAAPERKFGFALARASSGTYAFSGRFDDAVARFSEEWAGSGTMTEDPSPSGLASSFSASGSIEHGTWLMAVVARAAAGNHVHTIQRDAKGAIIDEQRFDQDGFGVPPFDALGPPFSASAAASFDIASGSREMLVDSQVSSGAKARATLQWSAFPAMSAPTSTTAE